MKAKIIVMPKRTVLDPQGKVMQSFFVINYWVGPYGDSTPPVIN